MATLTTESCAQGVLQSALALCPCASDAAVACADCRCSRPGVPMPGGASDRRVQCRLESETSLILHLVLANRYVPCIVSNPGIWVRSSIALEGIIGGVNLLPAPVIERIGVVQEERSGSRFGKVSTFCLEVDINVGEAQGLDPETLLTTNRGMTEAVPLHYLATKSCPTIDRSLKGHKTLF